MFRPNETGDDDWLLVSGEWMVGRVYRPGGARQNEFAAVPIRAAMGRDLATG